MGGSISAGADNDEMIDNLIKSRYIRTNVVEKVFRSVDRAFYFLAEFQHTAYRDLAWKQGNLHLSAPCIYSEVLEHLKLEPGHSFLNIGSGTGYLSTLAGLILGAYGTNHGIEVHADVVEYAYEKLELFKKTCSGVDVFEFCEPVFVVGNAFNLNQDRRYDRIYCGAACPEAHQEHIKKFMKVGGILVLPCEDDLLKITRTSEATWEISSVLPVSFSTLQFADKNTCSMISMPEPEPLRLQEICRSSIRSLLRGLAEAEEPELTQKRKCKQRSGSRKMCHQENCVVIPVFEDATGVENAFTIQSSRFENFRPIAFERLIRNLTRNYQDANDDSDNVSAHLDTRGDNEAPLSSVASAEIRLRPEREGDIADDSEALERVCNAETNSSSSSSTDHRCSDFIDDNCNDDSCQNAVADDTGRGRSLQNDEENIASNRSVDNFCASGSGSGSSCDVGAKSQSSDRINDNKDDKENDDDEYRVVREQNRCSDDVEKRSDLNNTVPDVTDETSSVASATVSSRPRHIAIKLRKGRFATKIKATKKHCSLVRHHDSHRNARKEAAAAASDEGEESTSDGDRQPKKLMKREKLDSGISEESDDGKFSAASNESSFAESTNNDEMEIDSDQDSDFTEDSSCQDEDEDENEDEEDGSDVEAAGSADSSSSSISLKYRACVERKIQSLPLPNAMKFYLNYNRDFLSSSPPPPPPSSSSSV
ncbi:uncharacterized protein LOC135838158 [Planococcus citri]|uniref:uncharacterized protein LOC135838158 n=1 Tax=Planococcus citri TaxID=170843 RepID=UPI0031F8FE66